MEGLALAALGGEVPLHYVPVLVHGVLQVRVPAVVLAHELRHLLARALVDIVHSLGVGGQQIFPNFALLTELVVHAAAVVTDGVVQVRVVVLQRPVRDV